jgi:hypothetical protein
LLRWTHFRKKNRLKRRINNNDKIHNKAVNTNIGEVTDFSIEEGILVDGKEMAVIKEEEHMYKEDH